MEISERIFLLLRDNQRFMTLCKGTTTNNYELCTHFVHIIIFYIDKLNFLAKYYSLFFLIRSSPKDSLLGRLASEEALFTFLDGFLFQRNTEGLGSTSQVGFRSTELTSFFLRSQLNLLFFFFIEAPYNN